jgi:hypothetical protein
LRSLPHGRRTGTLGILQRPDPGNTAAGNAFSKKVDNLRHAVALYAIHYNFCRVHQTLRITPAMKAGIADHLWTIEEMLAKIL